MFSNFGFNFVPFFFFELCFEFIRISRFFPQHLDNSFAQMQHRVFLQRLLARPRLNPCNRQRLKVLKHMRRVGFLDHRTLGQQLSPAEHQQLAPVLETHAATLAAGSHAHAHRLAHDRVAQLGQGLRGVAVDDFVRVALVDLHVVDRSEAEEGLVDCLSAGFEREVYVFVFQVPGGGFQVVVLESY